MLNLFLEKIFHLTANFLKNLVVLSRKNVDANSWAKKTFFHYCYLFLCYHPLQIGLQLRTRVRVKERDGKQMIYSANNNGYSNGVVVYLELDNRKCLDSENNECFSDATNVSA